MTFRVTVFCLIILSSTYISAGASLNEAPRAESFTQFSDNLFRRHSLASLSLYLCDPLYLALSGVILSLHRHIRPFTTNGALLPL